MINCPVCNVEREDATLRCVCGYEWDTFRGLENPSGISQGELTSPEIILRNTNNDVEIIVPVKTSGIAILFLGVGVLVWAFVGMVIIWGFSNTIKGGKFSDAGTLFIAFLVVWAMWGGFLIYSWLWNLKGKEHILITRDGFLSIRKNILGYGFPRKFKLSKIAALRVHPEEYNLYDSLLWQLWGKRIYGGIIAFEYESDTYRFGVDVNEVDAQLIVNELYKLFSFRAG